MAKYSIEAVDVAAYKIPTDLPESDGTLEWDSTTIVVVKVAAGGVQGMGYTYAENAAATLIRDKLAPLLRGSDAMAVTANWQAQLRAVRNLGRVGLSAMAISAVDVALWDLKARLLEQPLAALLGQVVHGVPAYGSGGFTSYTLDQLARQLGGWVSDGIPRVKMKVGRQPDRDPDRVRHARQTIGPVAQLFVDANGAYSRKQALALADAFAQCNVSWFEEPVGSDDLAGLRLIRDRVPWTIEVAAGEYGYDLFYFKRMLDAGAVDVLQADATRCGGISGFMRVAALCQARALPLSAHCAPSLHAHVCSALESVRHIEYFHDHARIEQLLFDGALIPAKGRLVPDLGRSGMGMTLKPDIAEKYALPT